MVLLQMKALLNCRKAAISPSILSFSAASPRTDCALRFSSSVCGPVALHRLGAGRHRDHRHGEDQFVLDQFRGPQHAVVRHQQRFVAFRQCGFSASRRGSGRAAARSHRKQEPLQAALAFQRQLGVDPQLDIGDPQRVAGRNRARTRTSAFGVREAAPQPLSCDDSGSAPSKPRRAATMRQASSVPEALRVTGRMLGRFGGHKPGMLGTDPACQTSGLCELLASRQANCRTGQTA